MDDPELSPSSVQIKLQVQRLLRSQIMQRNPRLALLFQFIVDSFLARVEIAEPDIRKKLYNFSGFRIGTSAVRAAKRELRQHLVDYYLADGRYDPVFIYLPDTLTDSEGKPLRSARGKAYIPSIEFNPLTTLGKSLRTARHYLNQKTPDSISSAYWQLASLRCTDMRDFEAILMIAEIRIFEAFHHSATESPTALVRDAFMHLALGADLKVGGGLRTLSEINSDDDRGRGKLSHIQYARLAMTHGILLTLTGNLPAAADSFDAARDAYSPIMLDAWFTLYLLAIGDHTAALENATINAAENTTGADAQALLAFVFYLIRDFEAAQKILKSAIDLNPTAWTLRLVSCLVLISQEARTSWAAIQEYERLCILANYEPYEFLPGLGLMCMADRLRLLGAPEEELQASDDRIARTIGLVDGSESREWWRKDRQEKREIALHVLDIGDNPASPVQRALIAIADHDFDGALTYLHESFIDGSPIIWWLRDIPLFDVLRQQRQYLDLLDFIDEVAERKKLPERNFS